MPGRINRAIELLQQDQAIYYAGHHTGHVLTHAQGIEDVQTWADYINPPYSCSVALMPCRTA
jgi:4-hydroxy-2-oxoheptanedioate aldolase